MPVTPNARDRGVDAWQLSHLQAVFFPLDQTQQTSPSQQQQWFQSLTGKTTERTVVKQHESTDTGPYGDNVLTLQTDLLRSTIRVNPRVADESIEFPVLSTGPEEAIDAFLELIGRWLDLSPFKVKRTGISGRFVQKTKTIRSGYRLLKKYLPLVQINSNATDLFFRINRPRKARSTPFTLLLNRLTTWAVLKRVQVSAAVLVGNEIPPSKFEEVYYCAIEFDMNTDAEFAKELKKTQLKKLLRELADLAIETAQKGDIR